jgi:hypothetical protein
VEQLELLTIGFVVGIFVAFAGSALKKSGKKSKRKNKRKKNLRVVQGGRR